VESATPAIAAMVFPLLDVHVQLRRNCRRCCGRLRSVVGDPGVDIADKADSPPGLASNFSEILVQLINLDTKSFNLCCQRRNDVSVQLIKHPLPSLIRSLVFGKVLAPDTQLLVMSHPQQSIEYPAAGNSNYQGYQDFKVVHSYIFRARCRRLTFAAWAASSVPRYPTPRRSPVVRMA